MSGFSGALKLTDLDDFIKPSQACINPVVLEKAKVQPEPIEIVADYDPLQGPVVGAVKEPAKAAKISLNDCLACRSYCTFCVEFEIRCFVYSGCITTAESVLITQQSNEEFLENVRGPLKRLKILNFGW